MDALNAATQIIKIILIKKTKMKVKNITETFLKII